MVGSLIFLINTKMYIMKYSIIFAFILVFGACSKEKRSADAGIKMQEFVINISSYARNIDPDFIIIPQNGPELAFNNVDPESDLNIPFTNSIDGFGIEELFYNGVYAPDNYRLEMLQKIKTTKKVLVSEYLSDNSNFTDALSLNYNEGFICFPRLSANYDYLQIPDSVPYSNADNITTLSQAKNYLYLISDGNYPSKEAMLEAVAATDFDVVIIDLFYGESEFTPEDIQRLKTKSNGAQRLVISYMNIGSAEKFRYYWKKSWGLHHPLWIRRKYEGYDDEFWVKFWKEDWQEIIYGNDESYTKKIINAGFDGVYLDNVEAYYFLYYKD